MSKYKVMVDNSHAAQEDTREPKRILATTESNMFAVFEKRENAEQCAARFPAERHPTVIPEGSEYTEHAEDFLALAGLEFRAVLVGSDCPPFCEDAAKEIDMDKVDVYPRRTHIHGKHYRCTISRKGRGHVAFDFWNSYADEEYNTLGSESYRHGETIFKYGKRLRDGWQVKDRKLRTVSAYDLLACITKYDPSTFENFCADFGYDEDSRKAEATYQAVCKEWQKVQKFFSAEELELIQEIS